MAHPIEQSTLARRWNELPKIDAALNYAADALLTSGVAERTTDSLDYKDVRTVTLPIADAGAIAHELTFENEGFVIADVDLPHIDYRDPEDVDRRWLPAVRERLLELTGGSHFASWGNLTRFSPRSADSKRNPVSGPFSNVHSDFGPEQFSDRIDHADAAGALKRQAGTDQPSHWKCFNIWMPISEPPYDAPLALCDASSFSTDDLVNSFIAFTDYDNPESGKTFTVEVPRYVYNPNHRWAYFPEMKPGQALFFLGLEWTTDGEPRAVPHTSFFDPSCPPGSTPRNSVETRGVLVFDA